MIDERSRFFASSIGIRLFQSWYVAKNNHLHNVVTILGKVNTTAFEREIPAIGPIARMCLYGYHSSHIGCELQWRFGKSGGHMIPLWLHK